MAPRLPPTPFLALDLDAFERNVARMARVIVQDGGKRWRPHLKSIRSIALARRLLDAGARGVTCATAREAAFLVDGGIDDVLIASEVVQAADLAQVARLNTRATVIIAMDHPDQAARANEAARSAGCVIPVLVEVDIGLGRAGVAPGDAAAVLARIVQGHAHLRFLGLMGWEGHATRIGDPEHKRSTIERAVQQIVDAATACRTAGLETPIVSCGGTGTFETTALLPGVTEVQAGGGVFGDRRYREEFHVDLQRALTLRASVLSRPDAMRVVCDAGWKSLAVHPTPPRPIGLGVSDAPSHSAEHLALRLDTPSASPAIGDGIDFEIGYADATTFLHHCIVGYRGSAPEAVFALAGTPSSLASTGESNHGP